MVKRKKSGSSPKKFKQFHITIQQTTHLSKKLKWKLNISKSKLIMKSSIPICKNPIWIGW